MIRNAEPTARFAPKSRRYRELLGPALLFAGAVLCLCQASKAAGAGSQWGRPAAARQAPSLGGQAQKPFGVQAQFHPQQGAMHIGQVVPGSVAAKAGIRAGDQIVGGKDASGRQIDFSRTGPQGFGSLVRQNRFTLFVYRRGVAEQRPMQVQVTRTQPAPKPRPESRERREERKPVTGGGSDSRWIGSGAGSSAPKRDGASPSPKRDARSSERSGTSILSGARRSSVEPKGSLEMRRHTFHDQGFGGMASHVMLLPKGWKVEGGALWTPSETIVSHFFAVVDSGDGRRITFDRARSFSYSQNPYYVEAMRRQGQRAMASFIAPPQRIGEAAMTVLMRAHRPQATNARVVESLRDRASEEVLRRLSPSYGLDRKMTVEAAVVSYEEGGRRYEELFWYPQTVMRMPGVMGSAPTFMWSLLGAISYRAPAGQLQANFNQLAMIAKSRKETPRWSLCRTKMLQEISRIRHKGHMDRMAFMRASSRRIAKTYSDLSDSQMASWRRQQAMKDEGHKKSVNGIADVHDYQSRDGYSFALDHSYDHVLEHKDGRIFMTNDVSLADDMARGGDYDRMKRIR